MTWAIVIGLALVCLGLLIFVLKVPRGAREAVASALLLGIAGYALQGSPDQPAAPKASAETGIDKTAQLMVDARSKVSDSGIPPSNKWVVIADGQARNGRFGAAAEVLRGAIEADPKNSEAWLAMANSLVAHADNSLTPASLYAYRRAASTDPRSPGPPFFLGLAFAQSGRFEEARTLWAGVVERAPQNAPWRTLMERQLASLDSLIAQQKNQAAGAVAGQATLAPQP